MSIVYPDHDHHPIQVLLWSLKTIDWYIKTIVKLVKKGFLWFLTPVLRTFVI